jgi:hypothetical protein
VLGLIFHQLQRGGERATCSFVGACSWGEYEGVHSEFSGLFFSSCREGESVPLVVSKVLVRGGNMRERTPSARSEQMRHSECSESLCPDIDFMSAWSLRSYFFFAFLEQAWREQQFWYVNRNKNNQF